MKAVSNQHSQQQNKKLSKFLSFLLRHQPEEIGLTLDEQGWANVDELINKINQNKGPKQPALTREILEEIVASNDKKRFIISDDGLKIRANQGHSIDVDLNLEAKTPPARLYHGTASRFIDSIMQSGLKAGQRHHVHLSENLDTAKAVGSRYGKPVILTIDTAAMEKDGIVFYQTENNVWLTDEVPVRYISGG